MANDFDFFTNLKESYTDKKEYGSKVYQLEMSKYFYDAVVSDVNGEKVLLLDKDFVKRFEARTKNPRFEKELKGAGDLGYIDALILGGVLEPKTKSYNGYNNHFWCLKIKKVDKVVVSKNGLEPLENYADYLEQYGRKLAAKGELAHFEAKAKAGNAFGLFADGCSLELDVPGLLKNGRALGNLKMVACNKKAVITNSSPTTPNPVIKNLFAKELDIANADIRCDTRAPDGYNTCKKLKATDSSVNFEKGYVKVIECELNGTSRLDECDGLEMCMLNDNSVLGERVNGNPTGPADDRHARLRYDALVSGETLRRARDSDPEEWERAQREQTQREQQALAKKRQDAYDEEKQRAYHPFMGRSAGSKAKRQAKNVARSIK